MFRRRATSARCEGAYAGEAPQLTLASVRLPIAHRLMAEYDTGAQEHLSKITQAQLVAVAPKDHEHNHVCPITFRYRLICRCLRQHRACWSRQGEALRGKSRVCRGRYRSVPATMAPATPSMTAASSTALSDGLPAFVRAPEGNGFNRRPWPRSLQLGVSTIAGRFPITKRGGNHEA